MRIPAGLLALLLPVVALAKQAPQYSSALTPPELPASEYTEQGRLNALTRAPLALYGVASMVLPGTPEAMAREYLGTHAAALGLRYATLKDLAFLKTRSSKSGHNVHFEQRAGGVPVYGGRLVVHVSPDNRVTFVTSGYQGTAQLLSSQPLLSAAQARAQLSQRLGAQGPYNYEDTTLVAYPQASGTRLAWRVRLDPSKPLGDWEALVDARSGEMFVFWDRANYATGSVFDPDPLSSSRTHYGSPITDNNDADDPVINKEVVTVDLGDLPQANGLYYLSGDWAELIDHETPNDGFFEQASPDFLFTREQNGFESVLTYHHIDKSMRYINETLGIALRPYQYTGGVQFDPQGLDGEDNSHYSSGSGQLAFGEGCVDDNEDVDVVLHELGHGLHDWVTEGGLSNIVDGLSEGFGDYWAQSYSRSLNQWTPSDPEYNWVYTWDGHNECWAGRVTNVALPYPTSVQPYPAVHSGGQHWATCLMKIYDQLGRTKTDTLSLEGLAMTGMLSTQNDAANATYQAAVDLGFPADELEYLSSTFTGCGYVMGVPSLPVAAPAPVVADALKLDGGRFGGALPLGLLVMLAAAAGLRRRS